MTQLILGLIITVLSALISLYEKWKRKNELGYQKNNSIAVALLLIAIIGAAMSFLAGIEAIAEKKSAILSESIRQSKIDSQSNIIYQLEQTNNSLLRQGVEYSKRLDSSSYENFMLSKEIAKQTQSLNDFETGKGSVCYFDLGNRGPTPDSYRFVLHARGTNPMNDVVARIADLYNLVNPNEIIIHIGEVYPRGNTVRFFETSYAPIKSDTISLNIFFQSGTRQFVEELRQVRSNGKWISSIIVHEGEKTIFREVNKNFPKNF